MTALRVVVLPGDGIGPEVTGEAAGVLEKACAAAGVELTVDERRMGGAAIDAEGTPLSDETLAACISADAVLLGAVGGPSGTTSPATCAASPGCCGCARGWASSPTSGRCGFRMRWPTAPPSSARWSRASTWWSSAS